MFLLTDIQGWGVSPRGAGYLFGSDVVAQVRTVLLIFVSDIHYYLYQEISLMPYYMKNCN